MKKFFIPFTLLFLLNFAYAQEIERYSCTEVKTDLADDKIQYSIKKENTAEFNLKNCIPENLKINVKNRIILYEQTRRLVEDGRIEKNDLFAIECYEPYPEDGNLANYKGIEIEFYRGRISPLITPEYPLYPTLKQTAEKLGLKMPHRTLIVFSGFGGASHEFFCYTDNPPSSDKCQYSFDEVLNIHAKEKNVFELNNLGAKYFKKSDYAKAEKVFRKAIEVSDKPDYSELLSFYVSTKQYKKAKEILFNQLNDSPYEPSNYISLAKIYLYEKKYDKAESVVNKALRLNFETGLHEAYYILGKVAEVNNEYRDAIVYFEKASNLIKQECEYFLLGFFDKDKSINCNIRALPYKIEILYNLNMLEQFNRAKAFADTITSQTGSSPLVNFQLSFTYAGRGEYEKALKTLDDVISTFTYRGIGADIIQGEIYPEITHVNKNSPAEKAGLKPGDRIVNIDNKDLRLYRTEENMIDMVSRYIQENKIVRFTTQSENSAELKDVELKPENLISPTSSESLAFKAMILRASGNFQEFEREALKSYELIPDEPLARIAISLLESDRGRHKEAIEILKKTETDYPDNLFLLARIIVYSKAGQIGTAKEFYKQLPKQLLKTKNAIYRQFLDEIKFEGAGL